MTDPSDEKSVLLTYNGVDDPDAQEVSRTIEKLKPFKSQEVIPGSIRVEGEFAAVASKMPDLKDWKISREGVLSVSPPHRKIR